jgi:hypothetical protein
VHKSWDEAAILKHTPGACNHGNVDSYAHGDHVEVLTDASRNESHSSRLHSDFPI